MTAIQVTTAADRTLLTAIHRPYPGCRWCRTRRVLTAVWQVLAAVWRVLVMTSRVIVAVRRALMVCVGITALTVAIERGCGRLIGIAAVVAWVLVGGAVLTFLNRRDAR